MVSRATIITLSILAITLLSGCGGGGGDAGRGVGSSNSFVSSGWDSYAGSSASSISGSTGIGTVGAGSTGISTSAHHPEPATVALLGGGLVAYALLRRRRKNSV